MLFSLFFGEVVDLRPMVIPGLQSLLAELFGELGIDRTFEGGELESI